MDWTLLSPDLIQQKGRTDAINIGGMLFMAGLVFTVVVLLAGAVSNTFPVLVVALLVFFVFGMSAVAAALFFYIKATGKADKIVSKGLDFLDYEIKRKTAALELPATTTPAPALPLNDADDETDTAESGEGEGSARLLHGFTPETLMWVCDYLANKNRWSETALERMPVPHVFPPALFGKAEGNTVYNRLFHPERGVMCRANIITGRGGEANATGKLAIGSPLEMMERIKALPEQAP